MRIRFVITHIFNIIVVRNKKLQRGDKKLENDKNLNGNGGPYNGILLGATARDSARYGENRGGNRVPGKRLDNKNKKSKEIIAQLVKIFVKTKTRPTNKNKNNAKKTVRNRSGRYRGINKYRIGRNSERILITVIKTKITTLVSR